MNEKPLDLLTIDTLTLNHAFAKDVSATSGKHAYLRCKDYTAIYAFGEPKVYTDESHSRSITEGGRIVAMNVPPIVTTILGCDVTTPITSLVTQDNWSTLQKEQPKLATYLKKHYNKTFLKEFNQYAIIKRNLYKAKVQLQFDQLTTLMDELGSNSDKNTMLDIDDLFYCEAEGFMLKLEERINKRSNPKNLKLYNRLQTIRGTEPGISCTDG